MTAARPRTFVPILCSLFVAAALVGYGCGSSSSSGGDPVALCKMGCQKYASLCVADAGLPAGIDPTEVCNSGCTSSASHATSCSNTSAITSAYTACLAKTTCADLTTCLDTGIPACQGGGTTGTGGTTGAGNSGGTGAGTGGTTGTGNGGTGAGAGGTTGTGNGGTGAGTCGANGTGGGSGSATCSVCDKAATCCAGVLSLTGLADGSAASECTAFSTVTCNGLPVTSQGAYASDCSLEISSGAQLNIAACL